MHLCNGQCEVHLQTHPEVHEVPGLPPGAQVSRCVPSVQDPSVPHPPGLPAAKGFFSNGHFGQNRWPGLSRWASVDCSSDL